MKILLIDDDKWIRDSLTLFFEAEGCLLVACETAEEALEALKGVTPDVIIADYRLPGVDGLELLRRVGPSHPRAIKILVTAYRSDDVVSEAASLGIDAFIEKPLTAKGIEESLSGLIGERQRMGQRP